MSVITKAKGILTALRLLRHPYQRLDTVVENEEWVEVLEMAEAEAQQTPRFKLQDTPVFVDCDKCGSTSMVLVEDALMWSKVKCECGALVPVPEPQMIAQPKPFAVPEHFFWPK